MMEGSIFPHLMMAAAVLVMLFGVWQAVKAVLIDGKARAAGHVLAGTAPDTRPIIACSTASG